MSISSMLLGNKIGGYISPSPPDVTKSPAYTAENEFAAGLGGKRSNFTNTAAPQVTEGVAPAAIGPGGAPRGATIGTSATGTRPTAGGGNNHYNPGTAGQTVYADPTGLNNQNFALGLDKSAAEGNAPSAAEQLYRKGTDEGMANQLALAATTQGDNPGMSQRAGLAGAQQVALDNSAGAGALRAQEMAAARGDYGNLSSQARGQTLQGAEANQAANLQQQLANNQFYLGLTDEQQKALQAQLTGAQQNAALQQQASASDQQFWGGLLSSGGKAIGSAGAG